MQYTSFNALVLVNVLWLLTKLLNIYITYLMLLRTEQLYYRAQAVTSALENGSSIDLQSSLYISNMANCELGASVSSDKVKAN